MGSRKIVVITGAAGGIGSQTAIDFASSGYTVVCVDKDRELNDQVVNRINASNSHALGMALDITEFEECKHLAQFVHDELGGADVLFNNAGVVRRSSVLETELADWHCVMDVNINSAFYMCKAFLPQMIANNSGAIVNTSSGWGINGGSKAAAYCTSKGAIIQLTKSIAIDYGKYGIRCNAVCPGDVDTGMLKQEAQELGVDYSELLDAGCDRPLGRIASPSDISSAVLYLSGEHSKYITGTTLVVDGGSLAGSA